MKKLYRMINVLVVMALLFVALAVSPTTVSAISNIHVNSTADTVANDGVCTLREAITAANTDTVSGAATGECAAGSGTDSIDFSVSGTITLGSSRLPEITTAMTIDGAGVKRCRLDKVKQ